jgi:hypothetical protein
MNNETPPKKQDTPQVAQPPPPSKPDTSQAAERDVKPESLNDLFRSPEDGTPKDMSAGRRREKEYVQPFISSEHITAQGDVVSGSVQKTHTGDVISNQYVFYAPDQPRSELLTRRIEGLDRILAIYVHTQQYAHAYELLTQNHVLVLWGPAEHGKYTTALHLLRACTQMTISELDPNATIEQLRSYDFEAQCGYVINTLIEESASELNSFVMGDLAHQLTKCQSYLVIIIDQRVKLGKGDLQHYKVVWDQQPDSKAVLERHLAWLLSDVDEDTSAGIQTVMQHEQVQNVLTSNPKPIDINILARLLHKAVRGDITFDTAIAQLPHMARDQVVRWFDATDSVEDFTLIASAAVFHGADYVIVTEAAKQLHEKIRRSTSESDSDHTTQSSGFVGLKRSPQKRLQRVCANLVKKSIETDTGTVSANVVTFDNPAFQIAVLDYIWEELDYHEPLLDWLRSFGKESSSEKRLRAAAVIGWWSRYDFIAVQNSVVGYWATSNSWHERNAAAMALGVLVDDAAFAPNVLKLLEQWCLQHDNRWLKFTAAAAYGGLVGISYPHIALKRLCLLTQTKRVDIMIPSSVLQAVVSLFERRSDDMEHIRLVLKALEVWTEEPGYILAIRTGLEIFLSLAHHQYRESASTERACPTLLWVIQQDEGCQHLVIELWRRVLNNRDMQRRALRETLRSWLKVVDKHEANGLSSAFEQLIVSLAMQGKPNEFERMRTYLYNRVQDSQDKSETARRLLVKLESYR